MKRGTYLILPIKYDDLSKINKLNTEGVYNTEEFSSDDFTSFLGELLRDTTFVDKYVKQVEGALHDTLADSVVKFIKEVQIIFFQHNIGFLLIYFEYNNDCVGEIYTALQPGYLTAENNELIEFINDIMLEINKEFKSYIYLYEGTDREENLVTKEIVNSTINESYCFNIAYVNDRFKDLETINQLTFNLYKLIDLKQEFIDESQTDVAYAYGARDVELGDYRWGTCITSQSISYIYGRTVNDAKNNRKKELSNGDLIAIANDDLSLTMLVLYQKYICMEFNNRLYKTLSSAKRTRIRNKEIEKLKRDAMTFKSTGVLAPSQISRWNNVCDTYRLLMQINGIDEALTDIDDKIELIQNDIEQTSAKTQKYIAGVVTLLGLISIVDSVLSIIMKLR